MRKRLLGRDCRSFIAAPYPGLSTGHAGSWSAVSSPIANLLARSREAYLMQVRRVDHARRRDIDGEGSGLIAGVECHTFSYNLVFFLVCRQSSFRNPHRFQHVVADHQYFAGWRTRRGCRLNRSRRFVPVPDVAAATLCWRNPVSTWATTRSGLVSETRHFYGPPGEVCS